MRVLVIKMSSMGDVLHTLPALTDATASIPGIRFDWVVEAGFAPIPAWHPAVDRVIPVSLRRWRKHPGIWFGRDVRTSIRSLRHTRYKHVIDAQGLLKSAAIARLARGDSRAGYASDSAREPIAARAYSHCASVPGGLHAIERSRRLFALTLGYEQPHTAPDYGITRNDFSPSGAYPPPYLVFNHASTWETKSWPVPYWQQLMEFAGAGGYRVLLPWGNATERERAARLAHGHDRAELLPRMELGPLAALLAHASAVVSVDTGLGHLAAALGTPGVSIYGATDPALTGTAGEHQHHLKARFDCSPCLNRRCTYTGPGEVIPACYASVSPDQVWGTLQLCINREME